MPYCHQDPKTDHNFDNHPYMCEVWVSDYKARQACHTAYLQKGLHTGVNGMFAERTTMVSASRGPAFSTPG